ncbi:hypothetical protein [Nisaea sp.]|uniref:hypothetical protein n=1 Tax=Nisaea sp. TaxID=2024842 RepID=UPI002B274E87|nr:hypothetical protein [Nisaea sp.]
MHFKIRTRPDGKFVEGICRGAVTGVSMVEAIAEMRLVDGYSDGLDALWDFREADLSTLSVEDMKLILDYMEQTPKRRSVRIAVLVFKDADFLLLKLWRAVSRSRYGQTTNVFSSHDEACHWLEESRTPDD